MFSFNRCRQSRFFFSHLKIVLHIKCVQLKHIEFKVHGIRATNVSFNTHAWQCILLLPLMQSKTIQSETKREEKNNIEMLHPILPIAYGPIIWMCFEKWCKRAKCRRTHTMTKRVLQAKSCQHVSIKLVFFCTRMHKRAP